jgi:glycosyltransferase involved in cell wall biosynthesis
MEVVDYFRLYSWVPSSRIILYQGNLNEGRGLQFITQTVKILPDDYKLIIIGNGPLKVSLINEVRKYALDDRIKFIDTIPLNELPNYTSGAQLGINLLESFNMSKQLASPNKLFEYIHAGIPVLASDTVENRKVLERFKIGMLTSNDPLEIAKNVKLLFNKSMDRFSLELSSAKEIYTWEKQEELLLSIIE